LLRIYVISFGDCCKSEIGGVDSVSPSAKGVLN